MFTQNGEIFAHELAIGTRPQFAFHALNAVRYHGKRVPELVRHAGREHAHCCQPFGVTHLLLEFGLQPGVSDDQRIAKRTILLVANDGLGQTDRELFSISGCPSRLEVDDCLLDGGLASDKRCLSPPFVSIWKNE
jgi:hypothetical protein